MEKQTLGAIEWFREIFSMAPGENFVTRRTCPACGARHCEAQHKTNFEFGRLRPTWLCTKCRRNGTGVFSLVKALNPKLATLAHAEKWLTDQGVEVTPEVRETGAGIFPLGPDGSNLLHQNAAIQRDRAKHAAAMAAMAEEAAKTPEARIAKLETELKRLKAGRVKA